MNLDRLPQTLTRWGAALGGILVALYSVYSAAHGNYGKVAMVFFVITMVATMLIARERMALAIPLFWTLGGQIPALGVPFSLHDLVIMVVCAAFLIFKAFKIVTRKGETRWIDLAIYAMIFYLVISFIRNPVGVAALESSQRVGGRPYFNVALAFVAYWILSRSTISGTGSTRFSGVMTVVRTLEGVATQFLSWIPALAGFFVLYYTTPFFAHAENPDLMQAPPGFESTKRYGHLLVIGQPILLYLFATTRPMDLLSPFRIGRFTLFVIGVTCILLSGFRSAIILSVGVALVASYVRRGWGDVWRITGLGSIVLVILVIGQGTIFTLPTSAQRALSFLPGKWDTQAKIEAEGSTEWRIEIWKQMLFTNRYIESHVWGDGFGFSKRDYEIMLLKQQLRVGDQESYMINGAVHSGPVSAVRNVGYVGLAFYIVILGGMAWEAWVLIRRAKKTPFATLTLLYALPQVVEPFYYLAVFGAFENSLPDTIYTLGIFRLLGNSLADYEKNAAVPATAAEAVGRPAGLLLAPAATR